MPWRWALGGLARKTIRVHLSEIRQIPGVSQAVTALYDVAVGDVWPKSKISQLKQQVQASGLGFEVIESVNIHDDIKIGLPTRDQYIENYKQTIQNLSEYGIKVICYNFMPVFDWLRTNLHYQLPDGTNAMAYEPNQLPDDPNEMIQSILNGSKGFEMPGAKVAADIAEKDIMSLDAPIGRVAAPDSIFPFAMAENYWLPNADDIEAKVREILNY